VYFLTHKKLEICLAVWRHCDALRRHGDAWHNFKSQFTCFFYQKVRGNNLPRFSRKKRTN